MRAKNFPSRHTQIRDTPQIIQYTAGQIFLWTPLKKQLKSFITNIDESKHSSYINWCVRSEPARTPRRNTVSRRCPF